MTDYDAVVIGAGPAGSAAAGTLAFAGRRVLVLEKEHFPRRKVCGEYLSAAAVRRLDEMGVLPELAGDAERIVRGSFCARSGREVPFQLPAESLGLSRMKLDDRLARWAEGRGAEVRFGARVRGVTRHGSHFRVRLSQGPRESELEARAVVGAWGRWDALDGRPAAEPGRRGRFLAWSRGYDADAGLAGEVRLYLFPGGYCGLSRIEAGRVHLAGLVEASVREKLGPWDSVVAHARAGNPTLDRDLDRLAPATDYRGAGPVYLAAKPAVQDGMLMIGDAAGVLDPFSGQGVACALSSGLLAARVLQMRFQRVLGSSEVSRAYAKAWRRRFGARFGWSAAFRRLVQRPGLAGAAPVWAGQMLLRTAMRTLEIDARARA